MTFFVPSALLRPRIVLYLTYRRGTRGTNLVDGTQFQAQLRGEIEGARRRNGQLTVFFLDVDDFKQINDDYGHRIGDESLKRVADVFTPCAQTYPRRTPSPARG